MEAEWVNIEKMAFLNLVSILKNKVLFYSRPWCCTPFSSKSFTTAMPDEAIYTETWCIKFWLTETFHYCSVWLEVLREVTSNPTVFLHLKTGVSVGKLHLEKFLSHSQHICYLRTYKWYQSKSEEQFTCRCISVSFLREERRWMYARVVRCWGKYWTAVGRNGRRLVKIV